MHPAHLCALVLLACGTAALLLSALALAVLPTPYARLHALAPATSLGVPLVCLALAVDAGPGRSAVKLLFVGALAAVSGPVTTIVIGRTMAREGEVPEDVGGRRTEARERGRGQGESGPEPGAASGPEPDSASGGGQGGDGGGEFGGERGGGPAGTGEPPA